MSAPLCKSCGRAFSDDVHFRFANVNYHGFVFPGETRALAENIGETPIFPEVTGRIVCLTCACGWAATYVLPEECFRYLLGVLNHLKDKHGVDMPLMESQTF